MDILNQAHENFILMNKPVQILFSLAVFLLLSNNTPAAQQKPLQLKANSDVTYFIASNGDDSRSGSTPAEAVRTLDRVQVLLKSRVPKDSERQIIVKFIPGRYSGISVIWDYFSPGRSILFEPLDYERGKRSVILDGQYGEVDHFFKLRVISPTQGGETIATGLVFRGLDIVNYCEGISIGDWKSKANVSGNVIEDNRLLRIGSKYQTATVQDGERKLPKGACVAAVRIQYASDNIVRSNLFEDIENLSAKQTKARKYGPLLLHGIYISNNSSGNLLENNVFVRFSGSPIRIRAQSDNNRVIGNDFSSPIYQRNAKPGYRIKAISQWYCNAAVKACSERAERGNSECPSSGTQIIANRISSDLDLYADESQSIVSTCKAIGLDQARFIPRFERNITIRNH